MMALPGREPHVSNRCVLSSGGALSRRTAHLAGTPRTSPLESHTLQQVSLKHNQSICDTSCLQPKIKMHELLQLRQGTCLRTRIVPCLYSAWLLSDDLRCGSAGQHDEQVPLSCASMSWFNGSLGSHAVGCAASYVSIFRPSWRSTTGGFPILVWWWSGSVRWIHTLAVWARTVQPSASVSPADCSFPNRRTSLMSVCTISACLYRCHAHDSRCTTQRQLRYHVKWSFPKSIACVVNTSQCRVSVRRTWMTWG